MTTVHAQRASAYALGVPALCVPTRALGASRPALSAPLRALSLALLAAAVPAWAEQTTNTAPAATPNNTVTTSARLDFTINIDKFLFFRIGTGGVFTGGVSGTGPVAGGTINTVNFALGANIPGLPTSAVNGNNTAVNWNGAAPTYVVASAIGTVLPVEVRSNAGQVRITASPSTLLTSGANTLPMSQITIASDDANLPGPVVPNAGVGAAVNVTTGGAGTGAAPSLLTYRTANWTFAYANTASPLAGNYSGQITFTASAP
jgi:hypothetical protein